MSNRLGIQITDSKIILVESSKNGNDITISNYLVLKTPEGLVENNIIVDVEGLATALSKLFSSPENPFNSRKVVFSFPESEGFVMTINIEKETKDQEIVDKALQKFEGLIDDVSFKFMINRFENENVEYSHLIGVRDDILKTYIKLSDLLGLELIGLEIESQAKVRSIQERLSLSSIILMNFGEKTSSLSIHDIYGINYSTILPFTGSKIDRKIETEYQISHEEAHRLKNKVGVSATDSKNSKVSNIISKYINRSVVELRSALKNFEGELKLKVKKVIIDGEVAELPGVLPLITDKLEEYIVEKSKVWINLNIEESILKEISVAIGLALKAQDFHGSLGLFNFLELYKASGGFLGIGSKKERQFLVKKIKKIDLKPTIETVNMQQVENVDESSLDEEVKEPELEVLSANKEKLVQTSSEKDYEVLKKIEHDQETEQADNKKEEEKLKASQELSDMILKSTSVKKLGVLMPVDDESEVQPGVAEIVTSTKKEEKTEEEGVLKAVDLSSIKDEIISSSNNEKEESITLAEAPSTKNELSLKEKLMKKGVTSKSTRSENILKNSNFKNVKTIAKEDAKAVDNFLEPDENTLITEDSESSISKKDANQDLGKLIEPLEKVSTTKEDKINEEIKVKFKNNDKPRKKLKIKKKTLLYLLLPIIFLGIVIAIFTLFKEPPKPVKYSNTFNVEIMNLDKAGFNIQIIEDKQKDSIENKVGIDIESQASDHIENYYTTILSESIQSGFTFIDEMYDFEIISIEENEESIDFEFIARYIIVENQSLESFITEDIRKKIDENGLEGYELNQDSLNYSLKLDKNSGTIVIKVLGELVRQI